MMKDNKDWKEIHEGFGEYCCGITYRQKWKKEGLTYQDAQEWISAGFTPYDYRQINQWKSHNFTPQEAKSWREIGLNKDDCEFATYLRNKSHQPNLNLNLEQLGNEFTKNVLDNIFPKTQREQITELNIGQKNLQGILDLSDFVNLKKLDCSSNKLINLDLGNSNKLTDLSIGHNNFHQNLSFLSGLVNLERLWVHNNHLYGSLEPLKNMSKLRTLDISNTDIDSGLEYLPESVWSFYCSAWREDTKCKIFEQELKKFGERFPNNLRNWKIRWQNQELQTQIQQNLPPKS